MRNNKLMMDAMVARMEQIMNAKFETFQQEQQTAGEQSQSDNQRRRARTRTGRRAEQQRDRRDVETASYYSEESDETRGSQRRHRRGGEGRDSFGGLKLRIPPFNGKSDPDAYLEWEKKIELVFNCQNYTEINKVRVAATEFSDYALSWWDQLVTSRRRNDEDPVRTWTEMKRVMRKRFVPSHHHRELHNKLRKLTQGSRSVEECYQELETLLIRADISEDRETAMSRFMGGLNRDLQDRLELQHYVELEEMLHKAILIEQQLKRKGPTRFSYGNSQVVSKPSYQREDRANTTQRDGKQLVSPRPEMRPYLINQDNKGKGKVETTSTRARDVKCFKCQGRGHYANECINKRVMVLLENGEYETEDEEEAELEYVSEYEEQAAQGSLLVTRRSLSLQTTTTDPEQRENLFHTRC